MHLMAIQIALNILEQKPSVMAAFNMDLTFLENLELYRFYVHGDKYNREKKKRQHCLAIKDLVTKIQKNMNYLNLETILVTTDLKQLAKVSYKLNNYDIKVDFGPKGQDLEKLVDKSEPEIQSVVERKKGYQSKSEMIFELDQRVAKLEEDRGQFLAVEPRVSN